MLSFGGEACRVQNAINGFYLPYEIFAFVFENGNKLLESCDSGYQRILFQDIWKEL
jgi:hypothetical protein